MEVRLIPFRIISKDFEITEAINNVIFDHVQDIEKFFDRIIDVEVFLAEPHRHKHQGRIFQITIKVRVPGPDIIVSREPAVDRAHEDFYVALGDAFAKAKRKLEDQVRRMRHEVKYIEKTPQAHVQKLFKLDGYGFIETPEGREIYFHENSLVNGHFDDLAVGTKVRFSEEMGEKGPQVVSMHIVGKNGGRISVRS
jgi:ribosomal subunit interface protein